MAPPAKKAKLSSPGGVGNISSFFGPKKSAEAKANTANSPAPNAPAQSPQETKEVPREAVKTAPALLTGGEPQTTPTKDEVKPASRAPPSSTPEKLSPGAPRRVATAATACLTTGRFHCLKGVKPSGWQQYNSLYKLRLKQLAGATLESAERWTPESSILTDLTHFSANQSHDVVAVGVLFKDLKGRPNVIEEYKGSKGLLNDWKDEIPCLFTEKDTLWLEDAVMRVELEASSDLIAKLATGFVVAVRGTATPAGALKVKDLCFPRMPAAPLLPTRAEGPYLALVSGLNFGDACAQRAEALEALRTQVRGCSVQQVVVCGGLFAGGKTKEALKEINEELPKLLEAKHLQVMPGHGEPSNASLPQLQFHPSLFQFASPNFQTVGNPCGFRTNGLDLLGHSGQPIQD
ncbi:DNA polymerase delta small subunit (Hydroxyurea-sensitive protein 2), partial [Durusdinium trenchii]